jgi:hypothetical protein
MKKGETGTRRPRGTSRKDRIVLLAVWNLVARLHVLVVGALNAHGAVLLEIYGLVSYDPFIR